MKSKRSNTWLKHHNTVVLKESKAKQELEDASSDFEGHVKRIAVISAVSGLALLAGYGLYRAFSHSETPKKKVVTTHTREQVVLPETVKVKSSFNWKTMLMERIAMIGIKFVGAQLSTLLSNKLGIEEKEKD